MFDLELITDPNNPTDCHICSLFVNPTHLGKMEEEEEAWHLIGKVEELKSKPCRKMFMKHGPKLALFHVPPNSFFLTKSSCPHAKGPLEQGDIEEVAGTHRIVCPMHYYSFDLSTGESPTGLKLKTYQTKEEDGNLYGLTPQQLSLNKFD